jgi:ParB/RepB/Spo0J family partition protein
VAITVAKPNRNTKKGRQGQSPGRPAGQANDIYEVEDGNWDLLEIPFDQIDPNPFNERDMGDLDELAAEIEHDGLVHAVTVMHREAFLEHWEAKFPQKCAALTRQYTLGPGERRWRASMLAAQKTGALKIRANLRNDLIPRIRFILIKENYHRKDPSPLERARHIKTLIEDEGLSYSEVCDELNIQSKGTVSKLLDLLELPRELQDAVHTKVLTQKAAFTLAELTDAGEREAALRLVLDEDAKPLDAVHRIRVSSPNVSREPARTGNSDSNDQDAAGSGDERDSPEASTAGEQKKAEAPADNPTDPPAAAPALSVTRSSARSTKSATSVDRTLAARQREAACIRWLTSDDQPVGEELDSLVRRALLAGGRVDGRKRAHEWLTRSGKSQLDIKDAEAYFGTILSSGDDGLIELATWATALAGSELRAADRRRTTWDRHDAAHVQLLMESGDYVPETEWERSELERLGVSLANTVGSEHHPDQESE